MRRHTLRNLSFMSVPAPRLPTARAKYVLCVQCDQRTLRCTKCISTSASLLTVQTGRHRRSLSAQVESKQESSVRFDSRLLSGTVRDLCSRFHYTTRLRTLTSFTAARTCLALRGDEANVFVDELRGLYRGSSFILYLCIVQRVP